MSFTIKSTRTVVSTAAVALAMAASVAAAGPAGAATATGTARAAAPHTVTRVVPHDYSCDSYGSNSFSWWENCRITSGTARAMAACADGTVHPGNWVGVGYWRFGINCYPYALESSWIESGS
ncbi:hypothetical protein GCM10009760_57470 [Kitasatospora kazusensis]|uniref:Secreted protein n=1 Tax=Kitasatospora kazusensis TaxID=407974 RepID=A0ABP5LYF7_9ACTN